jgi:hypothetical protein
MIKLLFQGKKLLVTNGWTEGSRKIEVIDLEDPTNVCQSPMLATYPYDEVQYASGGLLNTNTPLICGGYRWSSHPSKRLDACFDTTDNAVLPKVTLAHQRSCAASVVLHGTTLWITGGILANHTLTRSTEFVELTGTIPGPDLPIALKWHCLVTLNETTVLLIGGQSTDKMGPTSKATFYFNINDQTWTEGPGLIKGRYSHSCALFQSPQHANTDTVIIAGGSNKKAISTTEFFNMEKNAWTQGT